MIEIILPLIVFFFIILYLILRKIPSQTRKEKVDLIVGNRDLKKAYSRLSAFHVDKDDSDN